MFSLRSFLLISSLLLVSVSSTAIAEDILVVGHISSPNMDKRQLQKIFLAKIRDLPNGVKAELVDLPEGDETRDAFYQHLVNRDDMQLKAYWSRLIFTGSGSPPKVMDSSQEVIDFVAENPGAIGYVNASDIQANASVKILLKLE